MVHSVDVSCSRFSTYYTKSQGFFLRCLHGKMDRFAAAERNILLLESWCCHQNFDRHSNSWFQKKHKYHDLSATMQIPKSKSAYAVSAGYPRLFFHIYIYVMLVFHGAYFLHSTLCSFYPPPFWFRTEEGARNMNCQSDKILASGSLKLDFRNGRGGLFLGISRFPRKKKKLPRNWTASSLRGFFCFGGWEVSTKRCLRYIDISKEELY